jgi:hypothetical protein
MIVVIESTAIAPKNVRVIECDAMELSREEHGATTLYIYKVASPGRRGVLPGDPDENISVDVTAGDKVSVYSHHGTQINEWDIEE